MFNTFCTWAVKQAHCPESIFKHSGRIRAIRWGVGEIFFELPVVSRCCCHQCCCCRWCTAAAAGALPLPLVDCRWCAATGVLLLPLHCTAGALLHCCCRTYCCAALLLCCTAAAAASVHCPLLLPSTVCCPLPAVLLLTLFFSDWFWRANLAIK